jgi:hypothetical protein
MAQVVKLLPSNVQPWVLPQYLKNKQKTQCCVCLSTWCEKCHVCMCQSSYQDTSHALLQVSHAPCNVILLHLQWHLFQIRIDSHVFEIKISTYFS